MTYPDANPITLLTAINNSHQHVTYIAQVIIKPDDDLAHPLLLRNGSDIFDLQGIETMGCVFRIGRDGR
jgi:hypothetical protein